MDTLNSPDGPAAAASNVYLCSGPRFELDYDASIAHCRATFEAMFPGEEFLPRAPEPEEIIIGDDEQEKEGSKNEEDNPAAEAQTVESKESEDASSEAVECSPSNEQ